MAIWVEMTDRDGLKFMQWRRTTRTENMPDDGLTCVCCNARAQEVPVHPELAKTGPATRLAMTHDFNMHMNWKSGLQAGAIAEPLKPLPDRGRRSSWSGDDD